MEDLQAAIQNVLADPAQMAQLQAMAAALGLQDAAQGTSESAQGGAESTKAAQSPRRPDRGRKHSRSRTRG